MHALLAVPHVVVRRARRIVPLVVLARTRQRSPSPHGRRRAGRGLVAAPADPRTARSSAPRSGTRRDARARTMRRPASRNHARPRLRPSGSRGHAPTRADRAPCSATGTDADRHPSRSRRASRWCGHSRAGPGRRRGSRPRPVPASPCATNMPAPETRAAAARTAARQSEPGLQDMHAQSVDVGHEARAHARRENGAVERQEFSHRLCVRLQHDPLPFSTITMVAVPHWAWRATRHGCIASSKEPGAVYARLALAARWHAMVGRALTLCAPALTRRA